MVVSPDDEPTLKKAVVCGVSLAFVETDLLVNDGLIFFLKADNCMSFGVYTLAVGVFVHGYVGITQVFLYDLLGRINKLNICIHINAYITIEVQVRKDLVLPVFFSRVNEVDLIVKLHHVWGGKRLVETVDV